MKYLASIANRVKNSTTDMAHNKGKHFFRLTPSDIEDVRRLTLDGKTSAYIADWIGCSKETVRNHRRRLGITPVIFRDNSYTDNELQVLIVMYALGYSAADIASRLGRTTEAIFIESGKLRKRGLINHYRRKRT